ncbi:murein hydrolase activator EnvC, partial [Zhongshania sp.]
LNRYGASRQGSSVTWQGIQLSGNEGDAVKAIHNGRVVFADWLRGAGLLIIVDHGGDYLSLYAHNQSLLRSEGDWVRGGEGIATVGNSGGQRQAGLYFEIRYKGRPTDPRNWCK